MSTEIELKYLLSDENIDNEDLTNKITNMLTTQKLDFDFSVKELANDYFDSDELDLRKMDIGLRIRKQQEKYEQTIKTAGKVVAGLHQRPEYNVDIGSNHLALSLFPSHIWPEHIQVNVLQQKLKVIFTTHFTRKAWLIKYQNSVIELAFDHGSITTDNYHTSSLINELEIELVTGEQSSLFDLAELLKGVVNIEPGNFSKAARGYALFNNQ